MHSYSKPILGMSAIRSRRFVTLLHDYEGELVRAGYNPIVTRLHLHSLAHFGVWLEHEGLNIEKIDDGTVAAFARHRARCCCPEASQNRARQVVSCVQVLVGHLRERGCVAGADAPQPIAIVAEFLQWMRAHRGAVEKTLATYRLYVTNLVEFLGDDPCTYSAGGLRDFLAKRYPHYGRRSIRHVVTAVRMFLRYLAVDGRCRVGLDQALTSPPNWSRQSLPRGLSAQDVNRVLMSCPKTPIGIRDRAALLLLVRLGLRAGDVSKLRFADLCFETATIRVSGKGRREVRLPLPQDVGDVLLEYLRARTTDPERVCVPALSRPLPAVLHATSNRGYGIGHIARAALKRAGVQPPRRGAHVFRHTAACQMLRQRVAVEGIAEVLRHRSVQTTGLYAKVDLELLEHVTQPWPEVVSC